MRFLVTFLAILCEWAPLAAQPTETQNKAQEELFSKYLIVPPSAEAAALGKYGNVPVSLFTGQPNISVPLFELKGKELSVPISLSYSAGGFKVAEESTWVGLGWTLNAGGVITRSVMGLPDKCSNYFDEAAMVNPYNQPTGRNEIENQVFYDNCASGMYDVEPDAYFFNFLGQSGSFYVDAYLIPHPIKYEALVFQLSSCMDGELTIIGQDGSQFLFADTETTNITYDDSQTISPISYTFRSSWFLTRIISPNSLDTVHFTYWETANPIPVMSNLLMTESMTYRLESGPHSLPDNGSGYVPGALCPPVTPGSQLSASVNETTIRKKFLKEIRLGSKVILFESITGRLDMSNPEERRLVGITLEEDGVGIRKYELLQSYFSSGGMPDNKRLKLDEVQKLGYNQQAGQFIAAEPPHRFEYNPLTLPSLYSRAIDHWGYYNGVENTSLIPTVVDGPCSFGLAAYREPDQYYMKASVLEKLVYPTGGYTVFEYEAHQAGKEPYLDQGNVVIFPTRTIGGLRVKSVKDFTQVGQQSGERRYEYEADPKVLNSVPYSYSAGVLYSEPMYLSFGQYQFEAPIVQQPNELNPLLLDYTTYLTTAFATSQTGLGTIMGSHVGYTKVREYAWDATSAENNGHTDYYYNIVAVTEALNSPFTHATNDIYIGDLQKEIVYDQSGQPLRKTYYEYTNPNSETRNYDSFVGYKIYQDPIQDNRLVLALTPTPPFEWRTLDNFWFYDSLNPSYQQQQFQAKRKLGMYFLKTHWKYMTKKRTVQFSQSVNGDSLWTEESYYYDNDTHVQLTRTETADSQGKSAVVKQKYPADMPGPLSQEATDALISMNQRNVLTPVVEQIRILSGNVVAANRTDYIILGPGTFPRKLWISDHVPGITEATLASYYRERANYTFNNMGDILAFNKLNDVSKAYVWSKDHQDMIAEVQNALSTQVLHTSFEEEPSNTTPTALTGEKGYTAAYTVVLPSAGTYTLTYWRKSGANPWELVQSTVSTSTVIGGGGYVIDEVRLCPPGALMTTYTYKPGIGMTSSTDPNNVTTYYEYDALGRLQTVRDFQSNILRSHQYNYKK
jgi:YD repeat-containing protein